MTWPFRYFANVFPSPTMERNIRGSNEFLATMNVLPGGGGRPYRRSPVAPKQPARDSLSYTIMSGHRHKSNLPAAWADGCQPSWRGEIKSPAAPCVREPLGSWRFGESSQ